MLFYEVIHRAKGKNKQLLVFGKIKIVRTTTPLKVGCSK